MEARARSPFTRPPVFVRGAPKLPDSVAPLSQASRAQVRASVTAFVRQLRLRGTPPEGMLVQVKDAAREALPAPMHGFEARAVIEDVVRWSIAAYYDGN